MVPPRAIQFNLDLTSTALEAKNLVDFLYESAVKDRYASRPGGQTEVNARNAALVVLLNLFQAWKWDAESPGVSYSRDRNTYTGRRVGYRPLIEKVLPGLVDGGFVNTFDTAREAWASTPDDELMWSKMVPSKNLLGSFEKYSISLSMVSELEPSDLVICKAPASVRIVDGNRVTIKRRVRIPTSVGVTEQVRETTVRLKQFNKLLSQSFIGWFVPDQQLRRLNRARERSRKVDREVRLINPYKKTLFRVFNNVRQNDQELKFGGRFAGGWYQSINREERHKRIWIDDAFGVEMDFSSMEPTIAYAMQRIEGPSDTYALELICADFLAGVRHEAEQAPAA